MRETGSVLGCLPRRREGGGEPCVEGAGASFQSKQLQEVQAAGPRPPGAAGHNSAFP